MKPKIIAEQIINNDFLLQTPSGNDPYWLHQLALHPLLANVANNKQRDRFVSASGVDEPLFLKFLQRQGLAALWAEMLHHSDTPPPLSKGFTQALKQSRIHTTGLYLAQEDSP